MIIVDINHPEHIRQFYLFISQVLDVDSKIDLKSLLQAFSHPGDVQFWIASICKNSVNAQQISQTLFNYIRDILVDHHII